MMQGYDESVVVVPMVCIVDRVGFRSGVGVGGEGLGDVKSRSAPRRTKEAG